MVIRVIIAWIILSLIGLFFYKKRQDELGAEIMWNVFKGTWFIAPIFGTLSSIALSEYVLYFLTNGKFFSAENTSFFRAWFFSAPLVYSFLYTSIYLGFLKKWWRFSGINAENIHRIPRKIAQTSAILILISFSMGFIDVIIPLIQNAGNDPQKMFYVKNIIASTPAHFITIAYFTLALSYVATEKVVRQYTELNYGSLKTRMYLNTILPLAFSILYIIDAAYLIDISMNPTHIKFLRLVTAFVMLFGVFSYCIHVSLRLILIPVEQLTDALKNISSGERNLTQRLYVESRDDLGNLSIYFNRFIGQVHRIVKAIAYTSEQVNTSAGSLVHSSQSTTNATREISTSITQESQSLESVNEQITRMDQASSEIAENATTNTQRSEEMKQLVLQGVESMGKMISSMELINDSTQNIGGILGEIRGIAKQTNLLSLNAAIEAAKAGDHGKGFAVVAQHVRELAERSTNATLNIQTLIKESIERVKEGNIAVEEVQKILMEVSGLVHSSTESVTQITHAANEQSAFVHEVFVEITLLRDLAANSANSTLQIMQIMEQQNQAVQTLQEDANNLLQTVAQFKT